MPSPSEQQVYNGHMQYQHSVQYQQPYVQHHHMVNHQQTMHPKPAFHSNMAMIPRASPQPRHLKPSMAFKHETSPLQPLNTNVYGLGSSYSPTTPSLSTSGSTISSPPSSSMPLPTSINGPCFGFQPYEVVKEGRESEIYAESFANDDWSRSNSPPMTPGKSSVLSQNRDALNCHKLYEDNFEFWMHFVDIEQGLIFCCAASFYSHGLRVGHSTRAS